MTLDLDEALSEREVQPTKPEPRRRLWVLLQIGFVAFFATGMWYLVWSLLGSPRHWLHTLFLPALVVLLIGLFILRNEYHWARPTKQLRKLLSGARDGNIPIEELAQIKGGIQSLIPTIQQLLHDLRSQRTAVAELNHETQQRIASRTEALERQLGSMRQQAARDGLTGLYNRRMFDVFLPQLVERCAADRLELSVLVIDVDHFKILNDTLGHSAGDKLLRDIGQIIRSGLRDQDPPFRVGGDEFVVILPGTDATHAAGLSRRLIELVDALVKPLRLPKPPRLSIGIASLSEMENNNPQELVNRADRRLYETKSARRGGSTSRVEPLARSA